MHLNSEVAPWPFYDVSGSIVTLPFASQRLWDAGIAWSQVNTSQGVYDWTTAPQNADVWMSDAQAHQPLDELYTLARTPTWASSDAGDTSCIDSAENGGGQCHPPVDLNTDGTGTNAIWIAWVTAAAQYSKAKKDAGEPGFSYYEIWNEWNSSVSWLGTPQQLVRMEQDARCVVEGPPSGKSCYLTSVFPGGTAIDASAKIVSPSPVGAHPMLDAVSDSLQTYFSTTVNNYPGGSFSDVIGFHGCRTGTKSTTTALPCPTPEDVNTVIADMNTTLASFSSITAGKPLFNTEGGWSEADVEGFTDQDRQAAFLPRYLLLQQSADVGSRVLVRVGQRRGCVRLYNDTTSQATLAATAYGEVNQWTVGATVSKACGATGTVWTCGFTRPGGYTALAVWDASRGLHFQQLSDNDILSSRGRLHRVSRCGRERDLARHCHFGSNRSQADPSGNLGTAISFLGEYAVFCVLYFARSTVTPLLTRFSAQPIITQFACETVHAFRLSRIIIPAGNFWRIPTGAVSCGARVRWGS